MNSAKAFSFRNSSEKATESSDSENEDGSSSSSSSSSSKLSSSGSSASNSDEEAEVPAITLTQSKPSDGSKSKVEVSQKAPQKDAPEVRLSTGAREEKSAKQNQEDEQLPDLSPKKNRPATLPKPAKFEVEKGLEQSSKITKDESEPSGVKKSKIPVKGSVASSVEVASVTMKSAEAALEKTAPGSKKKASDGKTLSGEASETAKTKETEEITTKIAFSLKQKKTPDRSVTDEDEQPVKPKKTTEKIPDTQNDKKKEANDDASGVSKQKKLFEKISGNVSEKSKIPAQKSSADGDAEPKKKTETEENNIKTTSVSKLKKSKEKNVADEEEKIEKTVDVTEKPTKKIGDKTKKSTEIDSVEDGKVEKTKEGSDTTSKESRSKATKSSSEKAPDEANEVQESEKSKNKEKLSGKNEEESSEKHEEKASGKEEEKSLSKKEESLRPLTPETTSKETVKKRKKSPAKQVEEETVEVAKEEVKSEKINDSVSKEKSPSAEIESIPSSSAAAKESIDDAEKEKLLKPKKPKRSTKSPSKTTDASKEENLESLEMKAVEKSSAVLTNLESSESESTGRPHHEDVIRAVEKLDKSEEKTLADSSKTVVQVFEEKELESKKESVGNEAKDSDKVERSSVVTVDESNVREIEIKIPTVGASVKETGPVADNVSSTVDHMDQDKNYEFKIRDVREESNALTESADEISGLPETTVKPLNKIEEKVASEALTETVKAPAVGVAAVEEVEPLDDGMPEFSAKRESVDDFIQRILSEARANSSQRMKETTRDGETSSSIERDDLRKESETGKAQSKNAEDNAGEYFSRTKPPAFDEIADGLEESKPRRRYIEDDDAEFAAISKHWSKKISNHEEPEDYLLDPEEEDLERRAYESAAEILKRRKMNQELELAAERDAKLTMRGPKLPRRNFQRFNFAESDADFGDDGFLPKFRRDRGGRGGFLPEEVFVPRRREETADVVRQKTRGVKVLVEQQQEILDAVKKASRGLDDLEKEIQGVKQLSLGHRAHVEALESALDTEVRAYQNEYQTATEQQRQRKVHGSQEKKEDFLSLMFGPPPSAAGVDSTFSVLANTSTPAVTSFMNIYGSSFKGEAEMVNGMPEQRPPTKDVAFGSSSLGSRFKDADVFLAGERRSNRNEVSEVERETGRRQTGRGSANTSTTSSSISGWSPSASGINIDTSASDEFLNRVKAKYPLLSSPSPNFGDVSGFTSSRLTDGGFLGTTAPDVSWGSRFARAGDAASRSGLGSAASFSPADISSSWRDRGSGSRRDVTSDLGESTWRRPVGSSSTDVLMGRSIGSRTRRS